MADSPQSESDVQHQRWLWLVRTFDQARTYQKDPLRSSHALLADIDIQMAFRAGAWMSVIILACVAVEATIRQIEVEDHKAKVEDLFGSDPDLQWLRSIRNELMHSGKPGSTSIVWKVEGHDLAATHAALEDDAKRAIEIMFRRIYGPKQSELIHRKIV